MPILTTPPASPDGNYHYLVAINIRFPDGRQGASSCGHTTTHPILTFDHVETLQIIIGDSYDGASVLITSLTLLSAPTT
jgi:hypothetical protein